MELYDEDDNFIRKVSSAELEIEEEETTVIGVGGKSYTEVKASYEVSDANCAYARILGNISTIDSLAVFINLPGGSLPGRTPMCHMKAMRIRTIRCIRDQRCSSATASSTQ